MSLTNLLIVFFTLMLHNQHRLNSAINFLSCIHFQNFEVNGFEQLCINFANEQLQFYFNQHIFKIEQEEYIAEGLSWSTIDYQDNQLCLDLLCKRPSGIIQLLDDESNFPKVQ